MASLPNPGSDPREESFASYLHREDLGQIKNCLGILSSDSTYFYPKALLEIFNNASDLAQYLGIQRTQLYTDKIPLRMGSKLRKRMIQLVMATDLIFPLLGNNRHKTLEWLITPNTHLFGDTPFEAIMRDEGGELITWLMQRSGFKPGQAF